MWKSRSPDFCIHQGGSPGAGHARSFRTVRGCVRSRSRVRPRAQSPAAAEMETLPLCSPAEASCPALSAGLRAPTPSQGAGPGGWPALALSLQRVRGVDPLAAPSSEAAATLVHLVLATTRGRARPCCVLSRFSRVRLCVTPWPVAHQAPLSVGFSRQESWSGLPCPPPPPSSLGISVPTEAAEPVAGL